MSERWDLPAERAAARTAPEDLVARRGAVAQLVTAPQSAGDLAADEVRVGGVDCVVLAPLRPTATVLYFHGGGYRLGSARASTAFGARLARASGARVVLVDYRLAPEHPFPAALHDALAVYGALLDDGGPPVVGGDSAGGGLAAACTLVVARSGAPAATGLVLLSPWVDLTVAASSFTANAGTDQLFSAASAAEAADLYLQGHDPTDPLASPLFGDLGRFPPTQIFAGGDEVLLDDALALGALLARRGVSVETHVVAGMQHVWPTLFPDLPASAEALAAMARFVRSTVVS